jgi:hypothetical protein
MPDYATKEREYEDKEAYNRFQQLDQAAFDMLSPDEKDEYFELWKEFGDEFNNPN